MGADALDMALDDLVQGGSRKGGGKAKGGKGKTFKVWGGSKASAQSGKSRGKGWKSKGGDDKESKKESKAKVAAGDALDMSLDEVIEKEGKGKGKGGGKDWKENSWGKGKSRDKGEKGSKGKGKDWGGKSYSGGYGKNSWSDGGRDYDSGYSKGGKSWNNDREYSKGKSKGYSKGYKSNNSYEDRGAPDWNEHDDRDDDIDDSSGGKGGRRGGKGDFDDRERRVDVWGRGAGRVRSDEGRMGGPWQRIEQERERPERLPLRSMRDRDAPTRREVIGRGGEREMRGSKREAPDARAPPSKRRAAVEEPPSRSSKNIKVTNIPRNVGMNDIKDAFEQETGKISRCRLDASRGTAWIAFSSSTAARKAIETFDRGELNGQTIGVVLDN